METIEKGWKKPLKALKSVHEKYGKPILFTEVGYKSEADATIKPWEWSPFLSSLTEKKSDKTQQLAYEAVTADCLRVVLHLEQPAKHSKLFPRAIDPADIQQKLRKLVKAIDPHPLVTEKATCPDRVPWSVQ